MMNKKILLSVAAAATISTLLTGCGSSSDSSASTASGNAVKANLNGANVSMGGTSVKTDENGSFSVTGTGSTITITDGNYTKDGAVKVNSAVLKATKAQVNAGVEASMLTTLISEFGGDDDAIEQAFTILGIPYVAGVDLSTKKAANFEQAALAIAMVMEAASDASELTAVITSLKAAAEGNITAETTISAAGLTTALENAANAAQVNSPKLSAMLTSIQNEESFQYLVNELEGLEDNATADDIIAYDPDNYRLNNTFDLNATDGNITHASFTLLDNNVSDANLINANGNTSLFLSIQGLDAANVNASYAMALTGLNIAASGGYITLADTNTSVLSTLAVSDIGKAVTEETNATKLAELCAAGFLSATTSESTKVNVAAFGEFMASVYNVRSDEANETANYGSFTDGMTSGNYSISVSVNINNQTISKNNKINTIVPSSMEKEDYNGIKVFENMTGYQVIDGNITK